MSVQDDYAEKLKGMRPTGLTETLAEGMRPLDEGAQGLIEKQAAQGLVGNDMDSALRTAGVGDDYGLLGKPSGGMAMASPDDFNETLNARSRDAVAGTANRIEASERFLSPMRQAKSLSQSSANLAKNESLRFNNWSLKNVQALQKAQLQQAQEAAKKGVLSSILGLGGAVVGAGVGFAVGGPAGAVAGAGAGLGVGSGLGAAAG